LARKRAGCRAERRRPALADDIFQAFIGPMFFVAKVLVALGFRRDPRGGTERRRRRCDRTHTHGTESPIAAGT